MCVGATWRRFPLTIFALLLDDAVDGHAVVAAAALAALDVLRAAVPAVGVALGVAGDVPAGGGGDEVGAAGVLGAELAAAVTARVAGVGLALVLPAVRARVEPVLGAGAPGDPALVGRADDDDGGGPAPGPGVNRPLLAAVGRPARAEVPVAARAGAVDGVVVHAGAAAGALAHAVHVAEVVGMRWVGGVAVDRDGAPGRLARVPRAAVAVLLPGLPAPGVRLAGVVIAVRPVRVGARYVAP